MNDIPPEIEKYTRSFAWQVFPVHVGRETGEVREDGSKVILCTCGKDDSTDTSPGKHPRTMNGLKDATGNREQLADWCNRWSKTNWAVRTGKTKTTNIVVIDVDPRHGGLESVEKLKGEGYELPETMTHRSPGGGPHYLYDLLNGQELPSKTNAFGEQYPGIDIKGNDGYVLIPPSVGPNGIPYEVINSGGKAELPAWVFDKMKGGAPGAGGQPRSRFKLPQTIVAGTRSTTLFSAARSLAMMGLSKDAALAALKIENELKCVNPPMPVEKLERAVEDAFTNYESRTTNYIPLTDGSSRPGNHEHPRMVLNLESDNFYIVYYRFASLNEAPYPDYFHACATFLLSVAADRSCYLNISGRVLYPCIWSMLLGASTIAHKTDALEPVNNHTWISYPDRALPGHWSAAGLFDELSMTPRGFLLKDECANILSNINNNKEAGAARDLLMSVYECPDIQRKKLAPKKGKEPAVWTIEKTYMSMLLATTPENFSKNTTLLDVNSGWLLRFLYYYPNYKKQPVPVMFTTGELSVLEKEMQSRYAAIRRKLQEKGQFKFVMSEEGEKYFQAWHVGKETEIQQTDMLVEQKVFGRLLIAALKLSMLFTIGSSEFISKENSPGTPVEIPGYYVVEACRQIDEYFMPMSRAVIEMVERDVATNIQDKIRAKLEEGPCDRSTLLRVARVKSREFEEHIQTMLESGEVVASADPVVGNNNQKYERILYSLSK